VAASPAGTRADNASNATGTPAAPQGSTRDAGWVNRDAPARHKRTSGHPAPRAAHPPAARAAAAPASSGPQLVPLKLLPNGANGDYGVLDPTGKTYAIPPAVAKFLKPADKALDTSVLNQDGWQGFNPLKSVVGDFKSGQDRYQGKAILPMRQMVAGSLDGMIAAETDPAKKAAMQGMAAAVGSAVHETSVLRTPAQEFNINNGHGPPGNRIVFYGKKDASDTKHVDAGGDSDVDRIAALLGQRDHVRLTKQMVHLNGPSQGGTPDAILNDGVGGATHGGGFSSGFIDGKPKSIFSDWPADYGRLSEDNKTYNAHLFAINYQGGTQKPIPESDRIAYKNNADMWDAVLGAVVPFASQDPDPRHTDYTYNPLDAWDQKSLKSLANDATNLDWNTFSKEHGAFYCAEGQNIVANLGPQEGTLMKRSNFEFQKNDDGSFKLDAAGKKIPTRLGELINEYQKTPAYAGKSEAWKQQHPELGWKHLLDAGKIDSNQMSRLQSTNRQGSYLQWIPEDANGWQKYGPLDTESNLIAKPMTVGTLAWSLINRYMPREGVESQVASEVLDGFKNGTAEQKQAISSMLGALAGVADPHGLDPTTPQGQAALQQYSFKVANGMLAAALQNPTMKERLFQKAGVAELTGRTRPADPNDPYAGKTDKQAMDALYDKFMNVLNTANNQGELNAGLEKVDNELRHLQVERTLVDASGNFTNKAVMTTMLYAAPASIAAWAQRPEFGGGPQVLQYVASAMHSSQEKN
jgi:hypothetical protein